MSFFARNYIPLGFAIVFGVANGYYAFQPLIAAQHEKLDASPQTEKQQSGPVPTDAASK